MQLGRIGWVLMAAGALLGACGSHLKQGAIESDGYHHPVYPYAVLHPIGEDLLPRDWVLDNYYVQGKRIKAKEAPEYVTSFELDTNGDGVYDDKVKAYVYDLLFVHQRTSANIFARTVPQSYEVANLGLDVVARRFADALAGGDFSVVEFGDEEQPRLQVVERRRYATAIETAGAASLAGQQAFEATITLKNVDQSAPEQKLRVVFVRPGFVFQRRSRGKLLNYPVLLIAGYRALPDKFDENRPDFDRFLNSISFSGVRGYSGPAAPPPAEAPPPEAPPADVVGSTVGGLALSSAAPSAAPAPAASSAAPAAAPPQAAPAVSPTPSASAPPPASASPPAAKSKPDKTLGF